MSDQNQLHTKRPERSRSQCWWLVGLPIFLVGVLALGSGVSIQFRSHSELQSALSFSLITLGSAMIGSGVTIPFFRPVIVIVIATVSPIFAFVLAFGVVWLIIAPIESRKGRNTIAALDRSVEAAPYLQDLKSLFPLSSLNYCNFGGDGEADIVVETTVNDRYKLTMHLPASFFEDGKSVRSFGEPLFHLNEITQVKLDSDGDLSGLSYSGEHYKFGSDEWNEIVENGGDFSAAGFHLRADPIDNIASVKAHIRREMANTNADIKGNPLSEVVDEDCDGSADADDSQ